MNLKKGIMKYILFLLLLLNFSCKKKPKVIDKNQSSIASLENSEYQKANTQNLYELIGTNLNSKNTKSYLSALGHYKVEDYFKGKKDYIFEDDGIQIRTNLEGIIQVIYCSNYKTESWRHKSFKGKLPFDISFSNTFDEIKSKIGEETLSDRSGFYGRTFNWKIQDSLKIYIELELPRKETGKIFIEQITLLKNK